MEYKTDLTCNLIDNQVIHHLSGETKRLISSSQIITSVSSLVKECFENSLDAGASNIQVRLENFGLNLIEIKDDGIGISYENVQKMFLPGFTSKISNYSDLDSLSTYGFRGEALAAICQLGETSVTTKRDEDALAMTYVINKQGEPSISHPSHLPRGTTIAVKNLFNDLPVRKQYASSKKKMADELKKIEHVVQSLSVIHPELRVVITHNKSSIWQKNSVKSLKQSFMQVVGLRHASKMDVLSETHGNMTIQLAIPKKDASDVETLFSTNSWNSFVFVNYRPITNREIVKVIDDAVGSHWQITDKHVLCLVSVTLPPDEVDVNLEPNKTKVLLSNPQEILLILANLIQNYYGSIVQFPQQADPFETPCKKIKLDNYEIVDEKSVDISYSEEMSALCSQINKDNCTLASDKEKSELNNKFIKNCNKIVNPSINHIIREDIQEKVSIPVFLKQNVNGQLSTERKRTFEKIDDFIDNQYRETIPELCNDNSYQINENTTNQKDLSSAKLNFHEARAVSCDFDSNGLPDVSFSLAENINYPDISDGSYAEINIEQSSRKENIMMGNDASLCAEQLNITKDSWSRGKVVLQNGTNLKSGAVLLTNNKFIKSSNDSLIKESKWNDNSKSFEMSDDTVSKEIGEDVSKFNLSLQSVSSQMGKKEHSGFTKFARIMRPKIIAENPNIMFTAVSKMLVERWQLLSNDEKEYYETVAKAVDEERKIHRNQKIVTVPSKPVKPQHPAFSSKAAKRPDRKKIQFAVDLNAIVNLRKKIHTSQNSDNQLHKLIGQLQEHGNWLLLNNQEICVVRHSGLNELILFHKMMANFAIATRKLDRPEFLNDENLGKTNWNCLLSLDSEFDDKINRYVLTSPVIVKNGFRIEIVQSDNQAVSNAFLTEVAIELEDYGITELKEALELYKENEDFSTLDKLRPSSVRNYIATEVKRIVKNNLTKPYLEEIRMQLCTWEQSLKHLPSKCLHGLDIFFCIHKIKDLSL